MIRVFIYTYKKFSSPTYVLGLLRGLWEQAGNEIKKLQRRSAICYFLEQWFESQFVDFELGPIMAITQHWIKSMAPEHTTFLLPKLLSLEQILNGRNATKSLFSEVLPSMETKKGLLGKGLSLRDLDPEDVAHYYTLLDVEGMQATTIEEFWDIFPDNNFQKLIERGKRFSLWVASEIVKEADPVRRVEVMYFVLKVASCMLELNNMNGVMWTWLGLNHKALEKLNQTREKLPTAAKEIYSQVSKLCTFQKVLKEVTLTELKKVKDEKLKFVIPWFKSFERAFTNIEISYNDVVLHPEAGLPLLNYEKMFQYAQQINSFSQYQALLYPLAIKKSYTQNEAVLKEFLMGLPVLAEAEIGALVDSLE
uniref:Ras-GEF domain-containing protein n=1 Tax=Arcella intermedia TaxID=1963864 RepID=A0A6B2L781_9EUKA